MTLRNKVIGIFLLVLIATTGAPPTAFGTDYTDTKGPIVTAKLIQNMPSKGNTVIFEITAQDEKNEIKNTEFSGLLTHGHFSSQSGQIAPACMQNPKMFSYMGMQLIPLQKQSTKLPNGWFESKFQLIFYLESLFPLTQGCPEWRQGIHFYQSFSLQDVVGNSSLLLDDPPPWQTNKAPLSPFMSQLNPRLATDSNHYCLMPPYADSHKANYSKDLELYRNKIEIHRGKLYAQEILERFDEKYPQYGLASEYYSVSQRGFNIQEFKDMKLCKNLNKSDLYDLPWQTPSDYFIDDIERQLQNALGEENRKIAEAESRARELSAIKQSYDSSFSTLQRIQSDVTLWNSQYPELAAGNPRLWQSLKRALDYKYITSPTRGDLDTLRVLLGGSSTEIGLIPDHVSAKSEIAKLIATKTKQSLSKQKTIICTKGTISRKISGVNPKCPKGYKKK